MVIILRHPAFLLLFKNSDLSSCLHLRHPYEFLINVQMIKFVRRERSCAVPWQYRHPYAFLYEVGSVKFVCLYIYRHAYG